MKIVVVGNGKVGYAIAEQLSKEDHDIVMIDKNAAHLQSAVETLDVMAVVGNGASLEVQREADVGASDLLIAVTEIDEINIICCFLAKKLGCANTIARVRNPEYRGQVNFMQEELGMTLVINPELSAAREIHRLLQYPSFLARETFASGRAELVELKVAQGSPLDGLSLDKLDKVTKTKVLVCTVERADNVFIPSGSFVLQADDKITVTAATTSLKQLINNLGVTKDKVRNVMIIGGGGIAVYLARMLLDGDVEVKIVEKDAARCTLLSALLPKALIIKGDGTSQTLLVSEGLADTDALVALTDIDEENIILSMFAGDMGVPSTIAKVNRAEYVRMFKKRGVEAIVSPKDLSANYIVSFVRGLNHGNNQVIALYKVANRKAEALEFRVDNSCQRLNIPFNKLQIKENVIIACIIRGGKVIFPKGDDCFMMGDNVVIITLAEQPFNALGDIFIQ